MSDTPTPADRCPSGCWDGLTAAPGDGFVPCPDPWHSSPVDSPEAVSGDRQLLDAARVLIEFVHEESSCRVDHHGDCQEHIGMVDLDNGLRVCWNVLAETAVSADPTPPLAFVCRTCDEWSAGVEGQHVCDSCDSPEADTPNPAREALMNMRGGSWLIAEDALDALAAAGLRVVQVPDGLPDPRWMLNTASRMRDEAAHIQRTQPGWGETVTLLLHGASELSAAAAALLGGGDGTMTGAEDRTRGEQR